MPKKYCYIGGAICVVVLAAFWLGRGWLRKTATPAVINVFYKNSVQKTYDSEMAKLQNPLSMLGFSDVQPAQTRCRSVVYNGLQNQVDCTVDVQVFGETSQLSGDKATRNNNATKLQSLLQANDWQGEFSNKDVPYSSLLKLVEGVNNGVDYLPDATYQKQLGPVLCTLSTYTAFSKPSAPAISAHVWCVRTVNIFGQPDWQ